MKQLKLILIGGGDRGSSYLKYLDLCPEKFKLVAIAEPVEAKREHLADKYGVPLEMRFSSYEKLLEMDKIADIAMICTQDKMHFEPAMMALEKIMICFWKNLLHPLPKNAVKFRKVLKITGLRFWCVMFFATLLFINR